MSGADDEHLARLLRAAVAGDEKAYADFLRDAAQAIRGWARRWTIGGGVDAEDVVQEALLAAHVKRHAWREDAPVIPWLHAIARHKYVDAVRRQARRPTVGIEGLEDTLASVETEKARDWEIGRALEGLAPGQRSVVNAISIEGFTVAEAAQKLDMNETAVRVALHRGLAAIARRFGRN
ncbi:sigma-70 family RNA polymerase sigma factor [Ensifer adhaerens]|uniref:Sigma-70 family RNA polymerase sigma factor n=1 Tax=Ensifer adhaerens TaxID=106592 RepID=A0A9Q9DCG8_ENSAD|nr:sigma-70 family RNA polymerase sigma factor [Ensifer adhaerens]USJ26395.1 sigma-70 family RNA polymerase sigma factor [Ensifer adhaerens]